MAARFARSLLLPDKGSFLLFGPSGFFRDTDLASLRLFRGDYRAARCFLLNGGTRAYVVDGIRVLPLAKALPDLEGLLRGD